MAVEGILYDRLGGRPGWVLAQDGTILDMGHGECPVEPDVRGFILTDVLNMHTHCADYGLDVPPGMSLEDLVAPPDGLKHRYLRDASPEELSSSMVRFSVDSRAAGSTSFVDFREGGYEGSRLLREACPEAVILGRPISPEFDPEEVEAILTVADGIGLPSISDMDRGYIEEVADMCRERNAIFAMHASERVREDIDEILSLDPAFLVHMCEATDDDLCICAEAEVPIVVCPSSNRYFGKVPPIARAQMCGADLALGTDNGMLCRPDMMAEARVFRDEASMQGGDPGDCLAAMTRLSTKILKSDKSNPVGRNPRPVTILPSSGMSLDEALSKGSDWIRLEQIRRK